MELGHEEMGALLRCVRGQGAIMAVADIATKRPAGVCSPAPPRPLPHPMTTPTERSSTSGRPPRRARTGASPRPAGSAARATPTRPQRLRATRPYAAVRLVSGTATATRRLRPAGLPSPPGRAGTAAAVAARRPARPARLAGGGAPPRPRTRRGRRAWACARRRAHLVTRVPVRAPVGRPRPRWARRSCAGGATGRCAVR